MFTFTASFEKTRVEVNQAQEEQLQYYQFDLAARFVGQSDKGISLLKKFRLNKCQIDTSK